MSTQAIKYTQISLNNYHTLKLPTYKIKEKTIILQATNNCTKELNPRIDYKLYQICINDGMFYPTVVKVGSLRNAKKIQNFLEKNLNFNLCVALDKEYIQKVLRLQITNFILENKIPSVYLKGKLIK